MKKVLLTLLVIGLLASTFALFIIRSRKKGPAVISSRYSVSQIKETGVENHPQQSTGSSFKEFDLPQDLKAKLSEAGKKGDVNDQWGEGKISSEELKKAGLTPEQLSYPALDNKIKDITAGYSVSDKAFSDNLNNCLSGKTVQDEQTKTLNSEALSAMGFSALMEHNYTQAEEALTALTRDYAATKAAPMAHLELARLLSQEGRFKEAQQIVDKAVSQYGSDKEYVVTAQALKKELEANE
ncbi:MAG: tetratricopeptide repeat protein [Candidatus Omnitrophota bacterium]